MIDRERYGPWAVITGASAGLGEEFARRLAAEGFNLFLTARREDRLEALRHELEEEHGVEVGYAALDLGMEGSEENLARATESLDVGLFVNNAGFGYMGRFLDQDPARLEAMVRLNCAVVCRLAHLFGRRLADRGRGGMIITASIAGFQATPCMAVYGATKGFDLLLGEALGWELKDRNVDVLVLNPGATRTEFGRVAGSTGEGRGGMAAGPVVRTALGALGRKPSVVTGFFNKLAAFSSRFFPRALVTTLTAASLRKMVPGEKR